MVEALVISHIFLWLVVLALGVAVFALIRQVGVLYERVAPAGALAVNAMLRAGMQAPSIRVDTLEGKTIDVASGSDRARFLFFLSPTCPVCKTLLPALRSLAKNERQSIEVVIASDGGEAKDHVDFVRQHRLEPFDYVVSELLGRSFGVSKLPYAVLLNPDATVASFGIINSREHLDSLLEARERGTSSIQEFMQGASHAHAKQEIPTAQKEMSSALT